MCAAPDRFDIHLWHLLRLKPGNDARAPLGQMVSYFQLQQHSWPAPSVLWKLIEYGHTFLCLGPGTGCV